MGSEMCIRDRLWVLFAAFLVFFMNLGFAMVEAGLQQAKNSVNISAKNFIVFAISSIAFWFIGWGLMFGDGNGCLLYTSDAADDLLCVDFGGRRIIKKTKKKTKT